MTDSRDIKAVLWDFGGVILSSPFEAFNRFEAERGLPSDFVRSVNTHDPDANAWARLEKGWTVVTDSAVTDRQLAPFRRAGIDVVVVDDAGEAVQRAS